MNQRVRARNLLRPQPENRGGRIWILPARTRAVIRWRRRRHATHDCESSHANGLL